MLILPGANVIRNSKCVHLLLTALVLLCFAAGLTSCSVADEGDVENTPFQITAGAPSTVNVSNISGLSLTTDQKEYLSSDAKITYSLENSTDTEYSFGASTISIEVLQNGEWYRLAFRTDIENLAFDNEGWLVPPHSTQTRTASFYFYGDCVPAGTYRLVIGLTPFNDSSASTTEYLATEFSIVE